LKVSTNPAQNLVTQHVMWKPHTILFHFIKV
jgi:hypothetical protein